MDKKGKKKGEKSDPSFSGIQQKEIFQRLNFMYQASLLLQNLERLPSKSAVAERTQPTLANRTKWKRRTVSADELSRHLVRDMKAVGRKATVRL